ncbi:MAG TPA: DUF929 family protein [Acidimicrobiales bacterium]|nr:DUF929 family protein [Acidimicrobiales bacterium]
MSASSNKPSQRGRGSGPAAKKSAATKKSGAASKRYAERQARKKEAARDARRSRNQRYGLLVIALVVAIIGVLVIVKVAGSGGGSSQASSVSPPAGTPIPQATLTKVASVPLSTLKSASTSGVLTSPQSVNNPSLNAGGKPELLYIGAEYCPYCGAQRWPLYIALSKFGTFSPQPGRIHSAVDDGNVPTFTFYGTNYSSPYLSFVPVEVYTNHVSGNGYVPLQTPTAAQARLWQSVNQGGFPFIDFGGKQVLGAAQYSFQSLSNLSFDAVASQVGNNSTAIGADIDASAAALIKTICGSMSHGQPAAVCSS